MNDPEDLGFVLPSPPQRERLPLGALHAELGRRFFGFGAAVCLAGALLLLSLGGGSATWLLGGASVLLGAVALAGMATPKRWLPLAMTLFLLAGMALIALVAISVPGPRAHYALPLYGLLVYLLYTAAGQRAGAVGLVAALVLLVAVHFGPWAAPWPEDGPPIGLGSQLLALLAGGLGGFSIERLIRHSHDRADEREERFRQLLGVAADIYWEIDREHRLTVFASTRTSQTVSQARRFLGQVPWQVPGVTLAAEALDALLADLGRGDAFSGLRVAWSEPGGAARAWAVSGEPRHGDDGSLAGFWGVAREITHELRTQAALATTRIRYRELFERNPSPLILHRAGRVLDVNPAALEMLGGARAEEVVGTELLAHFEPGAEVDRARARIAAVEAQPIGSALPITDYRLQVQGRALVMRSTAVRVEVDDGPAVLTIVADDTDRVATEDQLQGSKAMLEHLVATSPELITLTEAATGRYVMVNRAFELTMGWSANEAVGRSSSELGVWRSPEDRAAFLAALREGEVEHNRPVVFRARDGRAVLLMISGGRFVLEGREYLVINARDVTDSERQRLEREAILDSASVGIAVTRSGRFVIANRRLEEMLGWPPGGLVGQPTSVNWADAAAFDATVADVVPRLERGEAVNVEQTLRRRDGSTLVASLRGRAVRAAAQQDLGFVWCVEDITERLQAAQRLAAARDAAEAANRAKSAFLANTSHELRTPLNGLLGLAQLARDPALATDTRDRYLEQLVDSAQLLSGVIGDILDLSRIEAGKLELEIAAFDLGELLRTLERSVRAQAQTRGLSFVLDLPPECEGLVRGDALRLRQVLGNYLSNALKFTDAGEVRLRVESAAASPASEGDRLRFWVEDTGRGIEPAAHERLFQAFSQVDESSTRRYGGTGLGLAICAQLARLMGGEVGVHSSPGAGSRFWLELPLPRESSAAAAAPRPATPIGAPPGTSPGALSGSARPLAGLRVLMVEDHAVNMLIGVAMLERWGAEVVQAENGAEAVRAVEAARAGEAPPLDLVVMDLQMPVMNGHEATRRLRDAGVRLPIVALTAAALVGEREEAFAAGMDDFLTKPIDAERLRDTLLHWAGRQH